MASITVVIPAYNIEEYIGCALESALRQDPPFHRIIVIDDGSTDDTAKIVSSFNDSRIIYHYQQNRGLGPARNTGISLAESDYLYFMDGDDLLPEGMTRFLHDALESDAVAPDAVLFSAIDFTSGGGTQRSSSGYFAWKRPGLFATGRDALDAALVSSTYPACAYLYIFRRALLEEPEQLRFLNILHEDEVFTPALLMRCGKTVVTNRVMYHRRIRPGSIMRSKVSDRNVHGYLSATRGWLEHGDGDSKPRARLYYRCAYRFLAHALTCAKKAGMDNLEIEAAIASVVPDLAAFSRAGIGACRLPGPIRYAFFRLQADLHAFKARRRLT